MLKGIVKINDGMVLYQTIGSHLLYQVDVNAENFNNTVVKVFSAFVFTQDTPDDNTIHILRVVYGSKIYFKELPYKCWFNNNNLVKYLKYVLDGIVDGKPYWSNNNAAYYKGAKK